MLEIHGKARVRVVAEKVIIDKGGWLEGTVYSRAITVEKGGVFSGDLNISHEEFDVPDEPMEQDRNIGRFDEDGVESGPT